MAAAVASPALQAARPSAILSIVPISRALCRSPCYFCEPKASCHARASLLPYKIPKPHSSPQGPGAPRQHRAHSSGLGLSLQTQSPQASKPKDFSFNSFNPLRSLQGSKLASETFSCTRFCPPPQNAVFPPTQHLIPSRDPGNILAGLETVCLQMNQASINSSWCLGQRNSHQAGPLLYHPDFVSLGDGTMPSLGSLEPELNQLQAESGKAKTGRRDLAKRARSQHKHSFSYYKDIYLRYENNVQ